MAVIKHLDNRLIHVDLDNRAVTTSLEIEAGASSSMGLFQHRELIKWVRAKNAAGEHHGIAAARDGTHWATFERRIRGGDHYVYDLQKPVLLVLNGEREIGFECETKDQQFFNLDYNIIREPWELGG